MCGGANDGGILDLRKLFLIIGNSAMLLGVLLTVARAALGVAQPWRRTGGVKVTAEPAIRPGTAVKGCALRPLCPGHSHEQPRSTAINLDPWVGLGQGGDLAFQAGDRDGQGVQKPTAVLDDPAWGRWQLELGQPGPPGTSPQAGVVRDAAVGQHRVPGSSARLPGGPGWPGGAATPVDRGWPGGDPGLGQQIRPQQLGQGGRIDLVVLEPGRGDGFAAAGMDQVRLQLQLLEQLDQPPQP
jgi:hypothetical protein